ncbi:MAG: ROK family protein, partial [Planctomycetaceae bacterium]|nr:ROK family protein [Planctomycetaceae bacterium]
MTELFAGVDLGGTTIAAILATRAGEVVAEGELPTESYHGPQHVLGRVRELLDQLIAGAGARPVAVGMGCPGLVDVVRGVTRFLPNLPSHWRDIKAIASSSRGVIVAVHDRKSSGRRGRLAGPWAAWRTTCDFYNGAGHS